MARPRKIKAAEDMPIIEAPQMPTGAEDVVSPLSSQRQPTSAPNVLQKSEANLAKMSDVVAVLESKNSQLVEECQSLKAKNEEQKGTIQNLQGQVIALKEQTESLNRKLFEAQGELAKAGSKVDVISDLVEIVDTVSADNPNLIKPITKAGKKYEPEVDDNGFARFRVPRSFALGQIYCTNQRFVLSDKNVEEIHGMVPNGPYLRQYKAVRHALVIKSKSKEWKPASEVDKE
jgi:hypothetical protein